jgi:hypothetical protein
VISVAPVIVQANPALISVVVFATQVVADTLDILHTVDAQALANLLPQCEAK